jgi:hypothetical protein
LPDVNRLSPSALVLRRRPFERISLARQFLLVSALVLLLGVGAAGTWVGRQIEASEVHREAKIAAVYVESILAARLDELVDSGELGAAARRQLDDIFVAGPLARTVVRFKLWTPDGRIHYSSRHDQERHRWPLDDDLAVAFGGRLQAHITELQGADNAAERERWQHLIEVYVPLRMHGSGAVAAVAEFYESMEEVDHDILSAQRQSWIAITLGALLLYSGLYVLVHRASHTIRGQQTDLQAQLLHLQRLLADNRVMNLRLQQAGAQTTSMSELSLRRIAADLHDGPAQDLAFALLTLDERLSPTAAEPAADAVAGRAHLRESLQRSMDMLRDIANGLVVPGMAALPLADVVRRAACDAARKSGVVIAVEADDLPQAANEAVKITTYRVVQEALSNSLRHAAGHPPRVAGRLHGDQLMLEVADDGPGFDPLGPAAAGHLGLAFLRERVQLLGGTIAIHSAPGAGTLVRACIPLAGAAVGNG